MDHVVEELRSAWPRGRVSVRRRLRHAGLRDNVLGAWVPASNDSVPAVFLEDDIELSPLWYHYVQSSLRRYGDHDHALAGQLVGISLFTPDDMNEAFMNGHATDRRSGRPRPSCAWQGAHARATSDASAAVGGPASAVLFGQPCSWGALFFARAWRHFLRHAGPLRRLQPRGLPLIPCPVSARDEDPDHRCTQVVANRWGSSSWKRLLALHMVAHGQYMVYPNLPGRHSFATNHVEQGVHVRSEAVLAAQRVRHRVPLVTREWCTSVQMLCDADEKGGAFELPNIENIRLFDFYCSLQPRSEAGLEALRNAGAPLLNRMPPPAATLEDVAAELRPQEAFVSYADQGSRRDVHDEL